jgi:hypothetical protein
MPDNSEILDVILPRGANTDCCAVLWLQNGMMYQLVCLFYRESLSWCHNNVPLSEWPAGYLGLRFAGAAPNEYDAELEKTGSWKTYHACNDALASEGTYVDDQKDGLWKEYWPNGQKKLEVTYTAGAMVSTTCNEWNRKGVLLKETPYNANGNIDGTVKWYHPNTVQSYEAVYVDGVLTPGSEKNWTFYGTLIA